MNNKLTSKEFVALYKGKRVIATDNRIGIVHSEHVNPVAVNLIIDGDLKAENPQGFYIKNLKFYKSKPLPLPG